MEPFKNKFNPISIKELASSINKSHKTFDIKKFTSLASVNLGDLEMKDRAIQISNALEHTMDGTNKRNAKNIKSFLKETSLSGFILWPISIYIESQFINDFEVGMDLLEVLTTKFTSEFGVRPYFEKYPELTYSYFHSKLKNKDDNVRRWISEGTRPNLPWGMNISHLNQNLDKNIKLIDNLKDDPSLYVRKSVANHMSDVTMLDSTLALKYLRVWNKSDSDYQKWIVKQALRNLVKKGNKEALSILGYSQTFKVEVQNLSIFPMKITDGDCTSLKLQILSLKKQNLMIDYIIGYPKKNGKISKKVYKLKSVLSLKNEIISIDKKISFKKVTTRVHYPGLHSCEVQINGNIISKTSFTLI